MYFTKTNILIIFISIAFIIFYPIPLWSNWRPFNFFAFIFFVSFLILIIKFHFKENSNPSFYSKGILTVNFITIIFILVFGIVSYFEVFYQVQITTSLASYYLENINYLLSDTWEFFLSIPLGVLLHLLLFLSSLLLILNNLFFKNQIYILSLTLFFVIFLSFQFDNFMTTKATASSNNYKNDNLSSNISHSNNPSLNNQNFQTQNLPKNTDVIIFLMEGISSKHWQHSNFLDNELNLPNSSVHNVRNCFIPIPHSSKSIFTLLTGKVQLNTTRPNLETYKSKDSLPKFFEALGYDTHFIFTQPFVIENIDDIAYQIFTHNIDSKGLKTWSTSQGKSFDTFDWGIDDAVLIDYIRTNIVNNSKPLFALIGFSNTHSPYFITPSNPDFKNKRMSKLERYQSSIRRTQTIIKAIVNIFHKKRDRHPLFIILSDHGESFGERNFHNHNYSIYNEETKVPCYFIHDAFHRKKAFKTAGLPDFAKSIKSLFSKDNSNSEINTTATDNIFSDQYILSLPLKSWNIDNFIGFIENDRKFILDKRFNQLYEMDLDEFDIIQNKSAKDFDSFYKKWNTYSE